MTAPIALYPDSLLSQVLMACTYPADINEAAKWSKNNSSLEGDAAVIAVQDKSWDPSVMSLVAFPQVLSMMEDKPEWVQNLGDAFLANSSDVMDSVQKLRKKAKDEGNLKSTEQQKVAIEEQSTETIIIIEPANPQVIYVPVYNPTIIYGSWWWPHYQPWYYYPPGYGFGSTVIRGIGFGIGIGITNALWGNCHWGHGHSSVNINVHKYNNINIKHNKLDIKNKQANWKHNGNNRRGVPYHDKKTRQQFNNKLVGADKRQNFRGRDAQRDKARKTLDKRAVSPAIGRKQLHGTGGDTARTSVKKANRSLNYGKLGNTRPSHSQKSSTKRSLGHFTNSSNRSSRSAFSGAGNTFKSRQHISRGTHSNRSMTRHSGGRHAGGGRRR